MTGCLRVNKNAHTIEGDAFGATALKASEDVVEFAGGRSFRRWSLVAGRWSLDVEG